MQYQLPGLDNQFPDKPICFETATSKGNKPPGNSYELRCLFDSLAALDGRMRMLLRSDGTCLGGSTEAMNLLTRGTPLYLDKGVIRAKEINYTQRLTELFNVEGKDVQTLAFPFTAVGGHLIIRATPVCDKFVCLNLQHASDDVRPELADLREVFNLTAAEASIVNALFLGHTPQEIAADHDNSIHTIRAHIRRCYDKLAIKCREELWRKLNAYRIN